MQKREEERVNIHLGQSDWRVLTWKPLRRITSNRWIKIALLVIIVCGLVLPNIGIIEARAVWRWYKYSFQATMTGREPYLGVYHQVDTSIYDDVYPSNPDPRIQEIANLMTEWYNLYIDMRYINREDVAFPPHTNPMVNIDQAAKYGLSKDVVDLLQMLPYYSVYPNWNFGTDQGEFLMGGGFLSDMRGNDSDWEHNIVDPFYASPENEDGKGWQDPNGPYMRPWFVTLTDCGNHGSIMILDTTNYQMWIIEQLGGTSDPALQNQVRRGFQSNNRNDIYQFPRRSAVEFLQDMIARFRRLEWIPGGLYDHEWTEYREFRDIYQSAGWPGHFSPDLFDRLRQEREDAKYVQQRLFEPIEILNSAVRTMKWQEEAKWMVEALTLRLDHDNLESEAEREELVNRRQQYRNQLHTPEEWVERQTRLNVNLEESKVEYQLFKTRNGRFADLTEEQYASLSESQFIRHIEETEILSADRDFDSRQDRMLSEAKASAEAVSEETWRDFAQRLKDYGQGTTTDSWLELDELKSIVYDDLDGSTVCSLLVEAIKRTKKTDI